MGNYICKEKGGKHKEKTKVLLVYPKVGLKQKTLVCIHPYLYSILQAV